MGEWKIHAWTLNEIHAACSEFLVWILSGLTIASFYLVALAAVLGAAIGLLLFLIGSAMEKDDFAFPGLWLIGISLLLAPVALGLYMVFVAP